MQLLVSSAKSGAITTYTTPRRRAVAGRLLGEFGGCVTDNAPVMGKARELLATEEQTKQRWEHVTHNGCLLHWLDLLIEALCDQPYVAGVLQTARDISKYFRNHFMAADILKKHQLKHYDKVWEPPLPGDTRCGTKYIVLQWVVKSWAALQAAVTDSQWKDQGESPRAGLLLDKTHQQMLTVKAFLKPVWTSLRLADVDGAAFTPYVYPRMLAVQGHVKGFNTVDRPEKLPEGTRKNAERAVASRWKELHQPIYSAAWQLNPATTTPTSWRDIDKEAAGDVMKIVKSLSDTPQAAATAMTQLADFRNRTGCFSDNVIWQKEAWAKGPLVWWEGFGAPAAELFTVAERVLSFVPVASSAERNWSCFDFIHSKLRARLYNDKSEELVFLYQNYRLLRPRRADFQEPGLNLDLDHWDDDAPN